MDGSTLPPTASKSTPLDLHIVMRIRQLREERGVSQRALSESIGLSFQQVQKYETGANRPSAAMLYGIARELKTNMGYFVDGFGDAEEDAPVDTRFFAQPGARELAEAFLATQPAMRDGVLQIPKASAAASLGWKAPAKAKAAKTK
jgi:transcriptional regulator with XRE-family HTH domain